MYWNLLRGLFAGLSLTALPACGLLVGVPDQRNEPLGGGGSQPIAGETSSVTTGGAGTGTSVASSSGSGGGGDSTGTDALQTCVAKLFGEAAFNTIKDNQGVEVVGETLYVAAAFLGDPAGTNCATSTSPVKIFVQKFELDVGGNCFPPVWTKGDYVNDFDKGCVLPLTGVSFLDNPVGPIQEVVSVELPVIGEFLILCSPPVLGVLDTSQVFKTIYLNAANGDCDEGAFKEEASAYQARRPDLNPEGTVITTNPADLSAHGAPWPEQ